MKIFKTTVLIFSILLFAVSIFAQNIGVANVNDIENILPLKARAEKMNEILEWRLDNIIPELMQREGVDMWLVICREYNEDPVYLSMVPEPNMAARRTSILIFHDRGSGQGVERLTGSFYDMGKWYKTIYTDRKKDQFETLAEFIEKVDPKRIGINDSPTWAFGDGLSASFRKTLENALGDKYTNRLVSAENLCIGWLETRSPEELSIYRHICGIAHDIIGEFFSNEVIVPEITTTEDVVWWIRQRITDLGLKTWFQPSVSIQRSREMSDKYGNSNVIRRGDLLHCDIGIVYLGLCTDTQENAYVCRTGETEVPECLTIALDKGNRLQDIFMNEFKVGRTGNDILLASRNKAIAEGLNPSIYTHPLGIHGHAAGTVLGLWDRQDGVPLRGDYPLHLNTCYSIELNNTYSDPVWGNIRMALEEDAAFTEDGCKFIDGRQEKLYIIK
ncbi:M24 family metallopeptidase [candidate division KSB1 bacterium]